MNKITRLFLFVMFLTLCGVKSLTAQDTKIKFKKGISTVDGTPYLDFSDKTGNMTTVKSMTGNELFVIHHKYYVERNTAKPNSSTTYSPYIKKWYSEVKLIDYDFHFEVDLTDKDLVKVIYQEGVVTSDGKIDEEKMTILARKYAQEISQYHSNGGSD